MDYSYLTLETSLTAVAVCIGNDYRGAATTSDSSRQYPQLLTGEIERDFFGSSFGFDEITLSVTQDELIYCVDW
jgi:hypothetical protein